MRPYPFHRSCRESTALLVAREDRALGWAERVSLTIHLAICKACPRFERQMLCLRNAMKEWRNHRE